MGARRPTSGGEAPWISHSAEQCLQPAPGLTGQGEERAYQKPERIMAAGEQAKQKTREYLLELLPSDFPSDASASCWETQLGDASHFTEWSALQDTGQMGK